jgi:hypothetical protein
MIRDSKERWNMQPENNHTPNREEGYEKRDASIRGLLLFGLGLAIVVVIVFFAAKWTLNFLSAETPAGEPASLFANARVVPPSPQLQSKPHLDLATYCSQQLDVLNSYGWVDQPQGVVHIPINRAMDLLLKQGFPVRPESEMSPYDKQAIVPVGDVNALPPEGIGGQCAYVGERPVEAYPLPLPIPK